MAASLPCVPYERHIYETGEVPTREHDWHDMFNGLVWCRLPRLKAAINAQHYAQLDQQRDGRRGPMRDALTLLDESGALVISRQRGLLDAVARREWSGVFQEKRDAWSTGTAVVLCGHALLDKLRTPYKAMTAHALLLHGDTPTASESIDEWFARLDTLLAHRLLAGLCSHPSELSPLPLMGLPGWWPEGPQDDRFYADSGVFRTPSRGFQPAPVHGLPGFRAGAAGLMDDSPGS